MRQGGPADTMLRRIVLPENYVEGIDTNPYAFTNMECTSVGGSGDWILTDGRTRTIRTASAWRPRPTSPGVVPDTCKDDDTGVATACPTVTFDGTTFGIGDTNPILQGYEQGEGNKTRVLTWHQCPSDGAALDTSELKRYVLRLRDGQPNGRLREPEGPELVQPTRRLQGPSRLHRRRLRDVPVRLVTELASQRQGQRPL